MIAKDEVEAKAQEFDIHPSNVERDYVFGWLLCGIYTISELKDVLILKGGNAFRKAYFPMTRYSNDLDFSTVNAVDETMLRRELDRICDFVQEASGVIFDKERNRVQEKPGADNESTGYQARLYFKDFYGNPDTITISVRLDIREFDRLYLPTQTRNLIHPYSDSANCHAELRCMKLEEMLASKLKCLLQRRHSADLYDYVYAVFINNELAVNRSEIVSTLLKKTIFERSPGVVRNLLTGLPVQFFKAAWEKYIVCPRQSIMDFDSAFSQFCANITELFGHEFFPRMETLFYPASMRNVILEAGSGMRLMSVTYDQITRTVEPYSLVYKRRKDGHAEEYFYVWDRTGGRSSGPGIKALLNTKVQNIRILEEKFDPRFVVELSKAGEPAGDGYFSRQGFGGARTHAMAVGSRRSRGNSSRSKTGTVYIIE
jgi:predicted nucleotidyltransferase component of viral defense system